MLELSIKISTSENFLDKLTIFRDLSQKEKHRTKGKNKIFVRGNIAYLPQRGIGAFIGDLHGDFEALESIARQLDFFDLMKNHSDLFLIFLGDYGDRGKKILETISSIIALKLAYPNNIILLRGNHEEKWLGEDHGTLDAFINVYGKDKGTMLFEFYCEAMSELPVIALTANGIIGVHGGIPNTDIKSLRAINGHNKKMYARELTWNDPDQSILERGPNMRGYHETTFGSSAFDRFLKATQTKLMVRGHQWPNNGEELLFENRLAIVFSNGSERGVSSYYKDFTQPAFLVADLSEPKERFEKTDFVGILY